MVSNLNGQIRAKVLYYVASSYYKLSNFQKAEELLSDSLQHYSLVEANNLMARFLFMSHSFNEALGFYKVP